MKPNKLTARFLFVLLGVIINQFAGAQIVYTDIPDVTSSGTYNLDLNNDGTIDFVIQHTTKSVKGSGNCKGQTATNHYIKVTPKNNSKVLISGGQLTTRMVVNDLIDGSVSSWSSNSNQLMINDEWNCTYSCFYGGCWYTMVATVNGQWNPGIVEDGFLGLRIIKNGLTFFGWLRMSISEGASGFTIRDYAFNSVQNQSVLAGQSSTEYLGISPFSNLESYFCVGNNIAVPYIISGQFAASNIVTVELSDVTGSFANPVSMGNVVSKVSGTINAAIPGLTPSGYGYRIRVRSSDPVRISYSTPFNTYVHGGLPANLITVSGDSDLCPNGAVRLNATYDPPNGDICSSFQWRLNSNNIPGATGSIYDATITGDYSCIKTNGAGSVTSNAITVTAGVCDSVTTAKSPIRNELKDPVLNEQKLTIAPNPAYSQTQISFTISKPGKVVLNLFAMDGKLIKIIANRNFEAGGHRLLLDTKNFNAGVYILQMQTGSSIETKKLVVAK